MLLLLALPTASDILHTLRIALFRTTILQVTGRDSISHTALIIWHGQMMILELFHHAHITEMADQEQVIIQPSPQLRPHKSPKMVDQK